MNVRFDAGGGAAVRNVNYSSLLEDVFIPPSSTGDPAAAAAAST